MKKKLLMALVPLLSVGCGEELVDANKDGIADGINEPGGVTVVAPATPVGTVGGQVLSTRYLPMDGVEVTMTIGGALLGSKATTDATGGFSFKDVPAGSRVLLTFSKAGFVTARATAVIPAQAGNVPINNANANFGPVMLAETSGSVKFQVYTPNARPATGAKATLVVERGAYLLSSQGVESLEGQVVVQGEVDSQGVLSFSGIPSPEEGARINTDYTLYISPLDTDSDGIPDVDGDVSSYSGQTLLTGGGLGVYEARTIQLQTALPTGALSVKYASLGSLRGETYRPLLNMVRSSETIAIAFNKPIQTGSLVVALTDEYGKESLNVSKSLTNANTFLSITPGIPLVTGKEYNLYVRAIATSDGSRVEHTVPFIGGEPASPPAALSIETVRFADTLTTNGRIDANNSGGGETVYVNFNQVLAYVDSGTVQVFIDRDLNGNGTIGDATGEKGYTTGFTLSASVPTRPSTSVEPVFPLSNPGGFSTGFTTRFSFTYAGYWYNPSTFTNVAYPQLDPNSLPPISLKFTTLGGIDTHYQTAWGLPQLTDMNLPTVATSL